MIILDILYTILTIVIAMRIPSWLLQPSEKRFLPILKKLILYHFLFGVVYYFVTRNGGGDAWGYWMQGKSLNTTAFTKTIMSEDGTLFMIALNFIPAGLLGMPFFANTMFYSMLGALGMSFLFVFILRTIPYNSKLYGYYLFPLILFLPNLHFWSSGVGKDTVLFLCIAMFAYGLMKPIKRTPLLLVSILISLAIRPHIAFMLILSFGMAYFLGGKISFYQRILFSAVFIGIGIVLVPKVLEFVSMEELSMNEFSAFAKDQTALLNRSHTGSAINAASYSFPARVLTFLFRPFFFDARSFMGLISSFDNLILVALFIKILANRPIKAFKAAPFIIKGLVIFFICGVFAFSMSLGNVGIMIRMKNMFMPGFLIFALWVFSYNREMAYKRFLKINYKYGRHKGIEIIPTRNNNRDK